MDPYVEMLRKLADGEPVYLYDDFAGFVMKLGLVKSTVKCKGGKPYQVDTSGELVHDAMLGNGEVITEKEFDAF